MNIILSHQSILLWKHLVEKLVKVKQFSEVYSEGHVNRKYQKKLKISSFIGGEGTTTPASPAADAQPAAAQKGPTGSQLLEGFISQLKNLQNRCFILSPFQFIFLDVSVSFIE